VQRENPATDARPRLDDRDAQTGVREVAGRGKAGGSRARISTSMRLRSRGMALPNTVQNYACSEIKTIRRLQQGAQ